MLPRAGGGGVSGVHDDGHAEFGAPGGWRGCGRLPTVTHWVSGLHGQQLVKVGQKLVKSCGQIEAMQKENVL